jgi:uncharacterized protein YdaU (DUF1376 family)
MRRPIVIRTPYPTDDEVAKMLGLSARRKKELDRMMEEYFREKNRRGRKRDTPAKGRDGRKRSAP